MKKRISILLFLILTIPLFAQGTNLYDKNGSPAAFISGERTIFLWNGTPTAYLHRDDEVHIYGFNGKHLGWYAEGIIWDGNQKAVGFKEGAIVKHTRFAGMKGISRVTPVKRIRKRAPMTVTHFSTPIPGNKWSNMSLKSFLKQGI